MYRRNKQQSVLKKTLATAINVCPDLSISKVSKLKVEKVLNPPQKPVTTNSFQVLLKPNLV